LSGKDANLFTAEKVYHEENGQKIDIGLVGTVTNVNIEIIRTLERDRFIPVIAPIANDIKGETYNINADTAAGKIAEALHAEKLILLTDIEGVKLGGNLVPSLSTSDVAKHIASGEISGGMIPKVQCAVDAVKGGVKKSHIIDGRLAHAVLLEIFTDAGIGTEIVVG
jgi:acetylglutamate kinase